MHPTDFVAVQTDERNVNYATMKMQKVYWDQPIRQANEKPSVSTVHSHVNKLTDSVSCSITTHKRNQINLRRIKYRYTLGSQQETTITTNGIYRSITSTSIVWLSFGAQFPLWFNLNSPCSILSPHIFSTIYCLSTSDKLINYNTNCTRQQRLCDWNVTVH